MALDGVGTNYTGQQTSKPGGFQKFMNPSDAAIDGISGGNYKSYLNPLSPYSEDPEGNTWSTWCDPLMKTVDANINGDKTHFQRLNPIQTQFFNDTTTEEKIESWVDPGMSCVTSFIEDEKVADTVYTIFNPIGGIAKGILGSIFD